ncbi:MAG: ABC transporter ATP-binding protein [Microbacterium sp.]|nr:MAG: ABC transporter ATP-binding protein [Microbacterium sp.]
MLALELVNVDQHYGGPPVVQDVSLQIEQGSTVAIIGPNGAGKTTLFSVMSGEARAKKGKVLLYGKDVTRLGAQRLAHLGVSRTFQVARYFTATSVSENVVIADFVRHGHYRRFWAAKPQLSETAAAALDAVGMSHLAGKPSVNLSHGDRKNLEIAMALTQEPQVLLLDEPTAGMGVEDIPKTIALLKELKRTHPDLTIVITAHDMNLVFALADRVVLMANGRVVLAGTPDEVRDAEITREIYLGTTHDSGR